MSSRLEDYRKGLKPLVVEEWVDLAIYRPLGFVVALPLKRSFVTPNHITFLSALVGVLGAAAIVTGLYDWLVVGALLYMLSNVLDCSDGQLARMTGKFSRYGRIYDGVADYIVGLTTFLAIGIAWKPAGYADWEWWLLLLFGGIFSTTFQGQHLNYVRQAYLKLLEHSNGDSVTHKGEKKTRRSQRRDIFYLAFYVLYRFYLATERSVRRRVKLPRNLAREELEDGDLRTMLVLWTFTGKGSHVTLLAAAMLLGHPEYYLWFCLVPGNAMVWAMLKNHQDILEKLETETE